MIKKILIFIFLLTITKNAFAHPLDISNSTIWIKWDTAHITTYFHSFEVDYLLKNNWIVIDWIDEYILNKDIIKNYIQKKLIFTNDNKKCIIENYEFYNDEVYNILTDWFKVSYKIKCDEKIKDFEMKVHFFNNFPLQTNKFTVYDLNKWINSILYKVLTPKINYIKINDLESYIPKKRKDSDCDWLSDEDELIYKTNPNEIDTDWDHYTDYQEVISWQNPINKEYWPWQLYKEKVDKVTCKKEQLLINKDNSLNNSSKLNSFNNTLFATEYLRSTLKYISNYINNKEWNLLYIFLIVYVLWIIHAIWPWHSKSLLVAYTIDKENWYKKWIVYAFIFSISHILDILILFWITTLAFKYIDVNKYNYYIQLVSIILLFIFSITLMYKAFFKKQSCKIQNNKKTLWVAFLSWLAPCSFAWSIYFLLYSIWKLSFILPLIIALGLWILSTLIFIVIITIYLREKSLNKTQILSQYSSKVSALIIMIISIFMLTKTLAL
jgi:ABC-type nickel/cobalt efflux system permease component RcnA